MSEDVSQSVTVLWPGGDSRIGSVAIRTDEHRIRAAIGARPDTLDRELALAWVTASAEKVSEEHVILIRERTNHILVLIAVRVDIDTRLQVVRYERTVGDPATDPGRILRWYLDNFDAVRDSIRQERSVVMTNADDFVLHAADCPGHWRALWGTASHSILIARKTASAWLSGSFHPLHAGHRELVDAAANYLGESVGYELSIRNADKPVVDLLTLRQRLTQFGDTPVMLTNAATFVEKAVLMPTSRFVIGMDTAVRVLDVRFYGNSLNNRNAALSAIRECGCRFVVGGRLRSGRFEADRNVLDRLANGFALDDLFDCVPEECFRRDLSSTELREAGQSVWDRDPDLV